MTDRGMDEARPAIGQTRVPDTPVDLLVSGKRFSPVRLIPSILLCAGLAWFAYRGQAGGVIVIIVLILAATDLYTGLRRWMRPAKIELARGRFSICTGGKEYLCPAAGVANVVAAAKHVLVVFYDVGQVRPERLRAVLADQYAKQGFHVAGAPDEFTLDQVNQVRSALGLAPQPADEPGDRIDQFHRLLQRLTPRVLVTPTLVALCVGVFVAMAAAGVGILNPTPDDLIAWGGNYAPKTLGGQWWRLATSMFLHVGLLHLVFNMWVLWDIGRLVERFVGNVGFALAYLISGIAGSLASAWWLSSRAHMTSVGASGAVFGVLGLLLAQVARGRGSIPAEVYHPLRGSVIAFLAFNLLFGLSVQGIDMAAHLGGLAAGCLIGAVLARPLSEEATVGRIGRNLLVVVLGTAGLVFAARAMPEAPGDFLGAFAGFVAVEKQAVAASSAAEDKWRAGQLSDKQFADILVGDVLAPWRDAREHLVAIRNPPAQNAALLARLLEYAQLRQEGWEATVQWLRTKDPSKIQEANGKMQAADAVLKELNAADGGSR